MTDDEARAALLDGRVLGRWARGVPEDVCSAVFHALQALEDRAALRRAAAGARRAESTARVTPALLEAARRDLAAASAVIEHLQMEVASLNEALGLSAERIHRYERAFEEARGVAKPATEPGGGS